MRKVVLVTLSLMLFGCNTEQPTAEVEVKPTPAVKEDAKQDTQNPQEQQMITVTGTIRFLPMEGGFYGLDGENGKKYMPQGIDKSMLKNGLVVEVTGTVLTDMLTFQQYGEVLKVKSSKIISDKDVKHLNEY